MVRLRRTERAQLHGRACVRKLIYPCVLIALLGIAVTPLGAIDHTSDWRHPARPADYVFIFFSALAAIRPQGLSGLKSRFV